MVRTLFEQGLDSDEDVASAETQLDTAIAQATDVGVRALPILSLITFFIGLILAGGTMWALLKLFGAAASLPLSSS